MKLPWCTYTHQRLSNDIKCTRRVQTWQLNKQTTFLNEIDDDKISFWNKIKNLIKLVFKINKMSKMHKY